MKSYLKLNSRGGYHYLPAISPYSSGVTAAAGREIVHATLAEPLPWYEGLLAVRKHLESLQLERFNLCGVELRCPQPHPMNGFIDFNHEYRALLDEWDIPVDGDNPIARTNVSPVARPPETTVLHGFSYSEPSDVTQPTFVVAGGGELPHRDLSNEHIVRFGETSEDALLEKSRCVVEIMNTRLERLEADARWLSAIDVYTSHPLHAIYNDVLVPGITAVQRLGVHWYNTRPPVQNIEFEMDMRGIRKEVLVQL